MPGAADAPGADAGGTGPWLAQRYPRDVELADGRALRLRLMGAMDVDAVLAFAGALAPDDLMFLRMNITERPVVEHWVASIAAGRHGDGTGGRGRPDARRRHPAAQRGPLDAASGRDPESRSRRPRGGAASPGCWPARSTPSRGRIGLRLLTARMTLDQSAAQAVFRQLGFRREAVLWDYAITPDGRTRDLLVATKRL